MSAPNDDSPALADVRLATNDDADVVMRMMETLNQHEAIEYSLPRLREGYAELLAHPEWGAVLLAEVGGVPSGYALLAYGFDLEYGGRDAFLCELFVVERHRGKGVGKTLIAAVEAHARANGVKALHLIVRQENASAQVLYRRSGFTFDPRLLMSKPLS